MSVGLMLMPTPACDTQPIARLITPGKPYLETHMDWQTAELTKWKHRTVSEANVLLNAILANLNELESNCERWLDSHGDGCGCEWCGQPFCRDSGTTDGQLVENDLQGLVYNVQTAKSIIGGQIHQLDPDELEEAIKQLEAADDTDSQDDPMPTVIAARVRVEY
jgi:hypothetical protein